MEHPTTPAALRTAAETALVPLGEKRRRLLAELAAVETDLWPLVVRAAEVEVPQRRIQELTGLTPRTIRKWTAR